MHSSSGPEHVRIGIIGASGFAGSEVLRLAAGHPALEVIWATGDSQAGTAIGDLYPSLAAAYRHNVFVSFDDALLDHVDAVFLALPHGASQALVPQIVSRVKWVIDLAADFRMGDAELYPEWYGEVHTAPDLLDTFVYGLPELYRSEIRGASTGGRARLLSHGCDPGAGTHGACRCNLTRAGHRRRRLGRVGCRADRSRQAPPFAPSTRTSRPTGFSRIATRRKCRSTVAQRSCSRRTSRR